MQSHAATGIAAPARMQGRDIAPLHLAKEKLQWRTEFFYEHSLIGNSIPLSEALVRRDWKYMLWPEANCEQLFDLTTGPRGENDLARDPKQAARLTEMRARFTKLQAAAR